MPRPPEPRRHHYVPQLLLGGFTLSGSVEDFLWVHDTREHHEPRRQRPDKVAHERDFNRIEVEDTDPFAVEKSLAEIESQTAPIIREIERTWELPDGEGLNVLLYFVALLATRVPSRRESISGFMDQLLRMTLDVASATPERFERQKSLLQSKGYDVEGLEWQDVRDALESGAARFGVDQTWLIGQMLEGAKTIMECLVPRQWGLILADTAMPDFVCSDNPVSLVAASPLPPMMSPGFGMPGTLVLVPLTRRIVLAGRFEEMPRVVALKKPRLVAEMNSGTLARAGRWIFSPMEDFIWLKPSGNMAHARDVREIIEARGAEGRRAPATQTPVD